MAGLAGLVIVIPIKGKISACLPSPIQAIR